MIPVLLLRFVFLLLTFVSFGSRLEEVFVVSFVRIEAFGVKVDDIGGGRVEKFAVVTHHQQS